MHVFTFGGLSLSSADYTLVGRSCSSRRGGEMVGLYCPTGQIRAVLVRSTLQG